MTAEELIEMLKEWPPDLPVYIEKDGSWQEPAIEHTVRKVTPSRAASNQGYEYLLIVPY